MEFTPAKLTLFTFFKLPSAFWSGVRVKSISPEVCEVTVKHRWFNQNPFNSMYFAVQAMAAEFTTGALVMYHIKESKKNISMLVFVPVWLLSINLPVLEQCMRLNRRSISFVQAKCLIKNTRS